MLMPIPNEAKWVINPTISEEALDEPDLDLQPQPEATKLAGHFHCLARRPELLDPFDAWRLAHWATHGASHGERICISFVLNVFNQHTDYGVGQFDLVEAFDVLDPDNFAVIQNWAAKPFTL